MKDTLTFLVDVGWPKCWLRQSLAFFGHYFSTTWPWQSTMLGHENQTFGPTSNLRKSVKPSSGLHRCSRWSTFWPALFSPGSMEDDTLFCRHCIGPSTWLDLQSVVICQSANNKTKKYSRPLWFNFRLGIFFDWFEKMLFLKEIYYRDVIVILYATLITFLSCIQIKKYVW